MNIGAILVGIAVLIGLVAYIARPLFAQPSEGGRDTSRPLFEEPSRGGWEYATNGDSRSNFTARRDAIYALIRELDADHLIGTINDQDYQALRGQYVTEGVSVLKQLDALPSRDGRAGLETEIEASVLALRRMHATPGTAPQELAARFCTQCGHPTDSEDRFCARCGTPIKGTAVE